MIRSLLRKTSGGAVAAGFLLVLILAPARPAPAQAPPPRGELARLQRQAYDYYYRNSNRNVFRRSRHFHPTKNVFRSSRYYQQRLAASYDGYPLRTIVRYTEHTPCGPRERKYSFVHPRRHPIGPRGYEGYTGPIENVSPMMRPAVREHLAALAQAELASRQRPRTRAEIEMVPVHVARRPARQRAVLRTVTRADGTTITVIASEPIDPVEKSDVRVAGEVEPPRGPKSDHTVPPDTETKAAVETDAAGPATEATARIRTVRK